MVVKLLARLHSDGPALDPVRWPTDVMERRRASSVTRVWRSLYQQDPTDVDGNLFREAWWQVYEELPELMRTVIFVDAAYKQGVSNDYSVAAVWGKGVDGDIYLLDVIRRRVEFPALVSMVHEAADRHADRRPIVVVEDKASGQALVPLLKRVHLDPVTGQVWPALVTVPWRHSFRGLRATASKLARMEAAAPWAQQGRVWIPSQASWRDEWLAEHRAAPTGQHDDQVDTTVMAVDYLLGTNGQVTVTPDLALVDRDLPANRSAQSGSSRLRLAREASEDAELIRWRALGLLDD
jgi:predicted phage terminase large subunit-like protein